MSEDEMTGQHHRCNEHELEQTLGNGEGQGTLKSRLQHHSSKASILRLSAFFTERGPLEKGMASHFSILALRTP